MPRPHRLRRVVREPSVRSFKPAGVRLREMETVTLGLDELEALRWADLEGLYQEEAARRMGISRGTFARLVYRGRATVADALVNGKGLLIGEGPVAPPDGAARKGPCPVHGSRRRRGRRCRCRRPGQSESENSNDTDRARERRSTCLERMEQDPEERVPEPVAASVAAPPKTTAGGRDGDADEGGGHREEVGAAVAEETAEQLPSRDPEAETETEIGTGETMIVAISSQGPTLDSPLDPRFGRARWLLIVEQPSGTVLAVDNADNATAPHGAGLGAVATLREHRVEVLVTGRVGPKAEQALRAAGIEVRTLASGTCADALRALDGL